MPKLVDEAQQIADFLVEQGPSIQGVLLYGSVARGTESDWSDIDLLVVGTGADVTAGKLVHFVKRRFPGKRVGIVYLRADEVRDYLSAGTRFLVHIRREGRILRDETGVLCDALRASFTPIPASEEVENELRRLRMYDDLSRYGRNYLFCLAHIYTVAKTIVMARLADEDVYEFDRDRAFERFGERWPSTEPALETVRALRPFYSLVSNRQPERLPFSFRGNEAKVQAAVAAVRDIAAASAPQLV